MEPEKVRPNNFNVHTIIHNNDGFSVAYGKWQNGDARLAMRWNGQGNDIGYPSQGVTHCGFNCLMTAHGQAKYFRQLKVLVLLNSELMN